MLRTSEPSIPRIRSETVLHLRGAERGSGAQCGGANGIPIALPTSLWHCGRISAANRTGLCRRHGLWSRSVSDSLRAIATASARDGTPSFVRIAETW